MPTQVVHNDNGAVALSKLKSSLWIFGIPAWLLGITDRSIAAFTDGYLAATEISQLFLAAFLFFSWLYLKPEKILDDVHLNSEVVGALQGDRPKGLPNPNEISLSTVHARMLELCEHHLISQKYTLPFPYACQIYHLLNLKHLETIHNFSLNNLKIIQVNELQLTNVGGKITFKTILESPFNLLRIWRQPVVEVDLTLHSPYTVELSIPVYGNNRIIILFNALPLNDHEHRFFVDIYSNLPWPRFLLQILLHFAACLTLVEDLPYLQKLKERKVERLLRVRQVSHHKTMVLFQRFVDLYGSGLALAA